MDLLRMLISLQEYLTVYSVRLEREATRYVEVIPPVTGPFVIYSEESFGNAGNYVNTKRLPARADECTELRSILERWTFWPGRRLMVGRRIW